MRKIFICAVVLLCPYFVLAEEVDSLQIEYRVQTSGVVAVTETITYDFGDAERHGIFRTIDTTHVQPASVWYKDRRVELEVLEVSRNNVAESYELSGQRSREIKIGDADITVTGVQKYRIVYQLRGVLSYFDDGTAELYWNVTGSNWEVPVQSVTWSLSGAEVGDGRCYVSEQDCALTRTENRYETVTGTLVPGQELTIAVAFPAGTVDRLILEELETVLFMLVTIALTLLATVVSIMRYHGYHHRRRTVIAEYEPYEGIEPMFAGALIDDVLHPRDIAAGIIYLAEQGFLTIKRTERKVVWLFNVTDYEVTLVRPVADVSSDFLKTVLGLFCTDMQVGQSVLMSAVKRDTTKQIENAKTIRELQSSLRTDLTTRGFFENRSLSYLFYIAGVVCFLCVMMPVLLQRVVGGMVYGVVLVVAIGLIVYGLGTMRRRTSLGHEARYHLLGFKEFLSVTDKERFDFHNAPERSPEQFMAFLPYAIAFGVEEKWAEVFADMQITTPSWYDGQGTAFAATAFVHDVSAFSASVTASASASSGGGSAGGGGGGGGGGSW
jgi:uncharacterized membrane protein